MSFGKIVRKIVRKWLKKDNEAGILDPIDYDELYAGQTVRLSSEPCMFCVERDGTYGGDLNRNTHISDEMGFSRDGDGVYRRHLDDVKRDVLDSSFYPSSPFHGATPFTDDSTEFSFDSCHSSQSPVPLCVCEACYIFVSSNLPSAISASSTTAAPGATADRRFVVGDDDNDSECRQFPSHVDMNSKLVFGKLTKSGITSSESKHIVCNKDSSVSQRSNARQVHSASSVKRLGGNAEILETICPNALDELPVSVAASLDGEEGFVKSQRRLRSQNRWHDASQARFHPPPNKTICHVTRYRDSVVS